MMYLARPNCISKLMIVVAAPAIAKMPKSRGLTSLAIITVEPNEIAKQMI
jgi:hypothetical protein